SISHGDPASTLHVFVLKTLSIPVATLFPYTTLFRSMFGASFNTMIGQVSLAGEVAYRPKQPIINEVGDNLIQALAGAAADPTSTDRKSTRLNSSHVKISYAVFCLKKKTRSERRTTAY